LSSAQYPFAYIFSITLSTLLTFLGTGSSIIPYVPLVYETGLDNPSLSFYDWLLANDDEN